MKLSQKQINKNAINWIEALLSGKYKQTKKGYLKDITEYCYTEYCCWGVGCEIVGLPIEEGDTWNNSLHKEIGFLDESGKISPSFENLNDLAGINDNSEATFEDIGNYLIKHAATNFTKETAEAIKEYFSQINQKSNV